MENFQVASVTVSADELQQRKEFLLQHQPFKSLPVREIEIIAANVAAENHPPGRTLFTQEETAITHILIVKSGSLERVIEDNGRQKVRDILEPGRIYGGISLLFNNGISTSTVKCITEVTAYRLDRENFFRLSIKYGEFAKYFSGTSHETSQQFPVFISQEEEGQGLDAAVIQPSFLSRPVRHIVQTFPSCNASTSIRQAARLLTASRRSAALVTQSSAPTGLITDYDLRNKVIVQGRSTDNPVGTIMTSPLITVSSDSQVFEAILVMIRHQVKHLAVEDNGSILGLITERDLFLAQTLSPVYLVQEMNRTTGLEGLQNSYSKLPLLISKLIANGAKALHLNSIITALTDEVLLRIMNMALEEMGPPPARFAFMLLGSEGRREQTLKTDQDNAIVFEDVPRKKEPEVQNYFLELGTLVADWLHEVGQTHCDFDIMAKNPTWCQPLSRWQEYHRKWIETDNPDNLLHANIFFDFRLGYGDQELVDDLHQSLFQRLEDWPGFLRHMARNSMHIKPPLSFFGNFILEDRDQQKGGFDIKSAMRLVVDFARIYALQGGLRETNTVKRLQAMYQQGKLDQEALNNLVHAYEYLMYQRLKHQAEVISKQEAKPDNYLVPEKLTHIEQQSLKEAFKRIRTAQGKLRLDFFLHLP